MKVLLPQSEYAMSFEEIGQAMGISAACAKQTCYNGLRKLKNNARIKTCRELAQYRESLVKTSPELQA